MTGAYKMTFTCPGCGEQEFADEAGVVTCECGAHIETLEPLWMRRILPNYWSRLRGSVAPASPPTCFVCGKPAGPFGATFDEFCSCDQREESTFVDLDAQQAAEVAEEDAVEARWQAMEP